MEELMETTMTPERRRLAVLQHLARGGVLESPAAIVQAMHAQQRNAEPPRPWTLALAARGQQASTPRHGTNEPPKPWTIALRQRALEAR
jgi:hypothetical protein